MKKYWILQRLFESSKPKEQFFLWVTRAENIDEAWENTEQEIATNNSQEWLLTKEELKELQKVLLNEREL